MSSSSYPKYTGILLEALNLWYHNPAVTTPVLKLMAELVLNRSQVLRRCVCVCQSSLQNRLLGKELSGSSKRGVGIFCELTYGAQEYTHLVHEYSSH